MYILGQANIRILEGAVSILGRVLHENDHENYPIYSPPISALLFLENFSNDSKATKIELSSLNNGLEVISCPSSHFKAEDPTFKIFEENDLDLIHFSILNIPPSWRQLAEKLTPSSNLKSYRNPVVITCGPRKVGKSTFGRFIANSLINNHDNVAYLDLDCGQTEFSTPGFLCLQILSKDPSASILGILH